MGRRDSTEMYLSWMKNHKFSWVKQFKYLGSILTEKIVIEKEVTNKDPIEKQMFLSKISSPKNDLFFSPSVFFTLNVLFI